MINGLGLGTFLAPDSAVDSKLSLGQKESNGVVSSILSDEFGKELEKVSESSENLAYALDIGNIPQMQMLQVQSQMPNQNSKIDSAQLKISENTNLDLLQSKVSEQTKPVLKFMQAMYENFGIQPQQIMKALNELPEGMLAKSPREAMTPFFEKLELQPKEFTKAQILFNEMLGEMEQIQPQGMQLKYTQQAPQQAPQNLKDHKKLTLDALVEQKIQRKAVEPQNYRTQNLQPTSIAQVFNFPETGIDKAVLSNNNIAVDKLKEIDPKIKIEDIKINPNKLTDSFFSEKPTTIDQLQKMQFEQQSEMNFSEEGLSENLSEEFSKLQLDTKGQTQFSLNKIDNFMSPEAVKTENIKNILDQSQTLIQKGGGEMKIQLRPEGLGEVHLKVKVQDGQVGIQMMTDTPEAKRLLEAGLSELKLNLAEHKLNLNQIKVDVSEQMSQNMNQNQDLQREQARDFLSQFRQFNESSRMPFSDLSAARAYKKTAPSNAPDIGPIETRRNKPDSGRLYLVA